MRELTIKPARGLGRGAVLGLGEQLSRDARTRLIAVAGVFFVHAAYPPGNPTLAAMSSAGRLTESLLFTLTVAFPVNTFVILSFLSLAPRLEAGLGAAQLIRGFARRVVPVYLFWASAYTGLKAIQEGALPSPRALVEGIVLGKAMYHLYFVPMLLALTAVAPLLYRLARTPLSAIAGYLGLALCSIILHRSFGAAGPWWNALVGFLGFAPHALAGLALARSWGGIAPGPARSKPVALIAGAWVLATAVLVVNAYLDTGGMPLPFSFTTWAALNGYGLGVAVLLLLIPGAAHAWVIRFAPYTLGVYLIHPLFIKALRVLEARVSALAGAEVMLIVPNVLLCGLLSFTAVHFLSRTRLRHLVT